MRVWAAKWRWPLRAGALVVVGAILAVVLWPSPTPAPYRPPARARVYNSFTICLLTGPQGIAGAAAAPVWAGVEKASNATDDQAQFLAATGSPETVGSVTPYVNTLVQQRCGLVVAVGVTEGAAVETVAAANPAVRFMIVGSGSAAANVQLVGDSSADAVSAAVQAAISKV
jgi:basic membrane lipoprotein Med (substrate-binding protein (PBP1-ABC) superfamily)